MLEQMRRQGASIFIYFIFTLLIVIFVINFAPSRNRGGMEGGCTTSSNVAVTVDGTGANQTGFLIAYSSNSAAGAQKRFLAVDQLIRRELLAQLAEDRGIRTDKDLADEAIKHGFFFLGGQRIDARGRLFDPGDGEPYYSHKRVLQWVN